ncbi:MAG: phosphate ABC transporter substrate-binding protein PstS [Dysgonamonadaceae bacterium]|jgi:phosphate transport system substrate-binding protein|nr:phosphate ABC transporter substrate-binding protein PstS [Dysgonamonadaceae bacterium]
MRKTFQICFFIIFLLQGCGGCRHPNGFRVDLSGVGASFPQTFFDIAISHYKQETGNKVIYNETGSGSGIRAFEDKVVDFVVIDAYFNEKKMGGEDILLIPGSLGAIVIVFNIPGIRELNLNSAVIAGIYLGKIKYWDDAHIAALNPEIKLPAIPVVPVSRSDGSGTTDVFSYYLSQTNDEWKHQMGAGKSLKPVKGIAAKGNSMLANTIKNLHGSIGYVSMEHAEALNLSAAAIQNVSGHFVKASKYSLNYLADMEFPDNMILTDTGLENAYPLPCLSWILVYKNQAYNRRSIEKYEDLKSFLHYVVNPKTQKFAGRLTYMPLPDNVIEKAKNLIESMEYREI